MMTAVTVSPRSCATRIAASHNSSGTRTVRFGVAGWFGGTGGTLGAGAIAPTYDVVRSGRMRGTSRLANWTATA
jgi:hypothetical protein